MWKNESFDLIYSTPAEPKPNSKYKYKSRNSIYSLSQLPQNADCLCFGEGTAGLLNIWDVRVGKSSSKWTLHSSRINTIDFNPQNANLMDTNSKDGSACIWDLRYINANTPKYVRIVDHQGKPVHSAYFSPIGASLATTSLNNEIGICCGTDFTGTSMVNHYIKTARWIANFRATWGWDDYFIFVSNVDIGVDVISTTDNKIVTNLQSSLMSATPCRFAAHPSKVGTLAAATSGGQICLWT